MFDTIVATLTSTTFTITIIGTTRSVSNYRMRLSGSFEREGLIDSSKEGHCYVGHYRGLNSYHHCHHHSCTGLLNSLLPNKRIEKGAFLLKM